MCGGTLISQIKEQWILVIFSIHLSFNFDAISFSPKDEDLTPEQIAGK